MRLLRYTPTEGITWTADLIDESKIPPYAILSHVWQDDQEFTLQDLLGSAGRHKAGWRKIVCCAQQAVRDGVNHIWVDTCCIDKSSSAELSEAINSMFRWYRRASICYAYLCDVPARTSDIGLASWTARFCASRWFTRGWTLQELIAPRRLQFYSEDWIHIGAKATLGPTIKDRTGIPLDVLMSGSFLTASVAQRMSWAAGRVTSRREDAAYCLMGLFEVSMPMLYGEGDNAFLRLQEEIIKTSDDLSIFSWISRDASFSTHRGLLARSASEFAQCSDVRWARGFENEPYQITNKGIRISMPLLPRTGRLQEYTALLQGVYKGDDAEICIFLQQVGKGQYARVETGQLAMPLLGFANDSSVLSSFFVRQSIFMDFASHDRARGIWFRLDAVGFELVDVRPSNQWEKDARVFYFDHAPVTRKPPPVIFTLRELGFEASDILISLDASKSWGNFLQINDDWHVSPPALTPFINKVHCRKPQQPVIELVLKRGVFEGESRLILSVTVSKNTVEPSVNRQKLRTVRTDPS